MKLYQVRVNRVETRYVGVKAESEADAIAKVEEMISTSYVINEHLLFQKDSVEYNVVEAIEKPETL